MRKKLVFVCGKPDGPCDNTYSFVHKDLENVLISYIIINNVPTIDIKGNRQYIHDYTIGELKRDQVWVLNDEIVIILQ